MVDDTHCTGGRERGRREGKEGEAVEGRGRGKQEENEGKRKWGGNK